MLMCYSKSQHYLGHETSYLNKMVADVIATDVEEPVEKVDTGPVITIQDRIREKVSVS